MKPDGIAVLVHHWFPWHYLDQWWLIINWAFIKLYMFVQLQYLSLKIILKETSAQFRNFLWLIKQTLQAKRIIMGLPGIGHFMWAYQRLSSVARFYVVKMSPWFYKKITRMHDKADQPQSTIDGNEKGACNKFILLACCSALTGPYYLERDHVFVKMPLR